MELRERLIAIYVEAVRRLSGEALVAEALASLPLEGDVRILALGKASGSMLRGAELMLGSLRGLAVGPAKMQGIPGVEWIVGEHPIPGPGSLLAGERLLEEARAIPESSTALVLLSGGGSALAEALALGLTLTDLAETTRLLLAAGAPISEINAVRKHLSRIKGGKLAQACPAKRLVVLTVSDVVGDDPAVIASGPFAPDPTTFGDALEVLRLRGVIDRVPPAVRAWLEAGRDPEPGSFDRVETTILAGPADLPQVAAEIAKAHGFDASAREHFEGGDVAEVARSHLERFASLRRNEFLAFAAEPTVVLPPHPGAGGRSQHLSLLVAIGLPTDCAFLAAGSDGKDGLSDHAGAAFDAATAARANALDLDNLLAGAESARACDLAGASIPAWETGTNLADLHLLAREG